MSAGLAPVTLDALSRWCRFLASRGESPPPAPPDLPAPFASTEAPHALTAVLLANRLGPALDRAVAPHATALPAEFVAVIREDARIAAERGLRALATLRDVAAALEEARIPWLLWKGPALAKQVWGESTRRHFSDLDIVVARDARQAARDALGRAGWAAADALPARTERTVRAREAAYPLERGDRTLVELHWAFSGPLQPQPIDPAEVIPRAELVQLGTTDVRAPSGSDALLLLALHAAKHGWSQADEVLSFARLAARSPDALARARAQAARAGVPRVIALAERLVLRLLGEQLACATGGGDAVLARVLTTNGTDELAVDRMASACLARMCAGEATWRETHAWTLSWMSRRADRARYLAGALLRPTPQEPRWLRLPDALAGAYPAVRVARLALRAFRR
jgi:Uncharacterised nucleotidyltransferase